VYSRGRYKGLPKKVPVRSAKKAVPATVVEEDDIAEDFDDEDLEDLLLSTSDDSGNKDGDVQEVDADATDAVTVAVTDAAPEKPDAKKEHKLIDIPDTLLVNVPAQKRRKGDVPTKFSRFFKRNKGEKLSFIDLKREFINEIRNNNWYNKEDKDLIDLPANLRKEIGLEDAGLVKFDDIERVVSLFYN